MRRYKYILLGRLSYVPRLHALLRRGTGGTISARYCYSVWLRHLVFARRSERWKLGGVIAEVGPGDSLGIGLSALLSGFDQYLALDRVADASSAHNLLVFDELVELFRSRAAIPDDSEFPNVRPRLDDYSFPGDQFADLDRALSPSRVQNIRRDLESLSGCLKYVAPWDAAGSLAPESIDFVISKAVMEHIDDLHQAYGAMYKSLRRGGLMSHQIDFKSHETSPKWNGHLAYSALTWRLMRGNLPYLLNRKTCSYHQGIWDELGLKPVAEQLNIREDGILRKELSAEFRGLPDQDLRVAGAFVQLRKM